MHRLTATAAASLGLAGLLLVGCQGNNNPDNNNPNSSGAQTSGAYGSGQTYNGGDTYGSGQSGGAYNSNAGSNSGGIELRGRQSGASQDQNTAPPATQPAGSQ